MSSKIRGICWMWTMLWGMKIAHPKSISVAKSCCSSRALGVGRGWVNCAVQGHRQLQRPQVSGDNCQQGLGTDMKLSSRLRHHCISLPAHNQKCWALCQKAVLWLWSYRPKESTEHPPGWEHIETFAPSVPWIWGDNPLPGITAATTSSPSCSILLPSISKMRNDCISGTNEVLSSFPNVLCNAMSPWRWHQVHLSPQPPQNNEVKHKARLVKCLCGLGMDSRPLEMQLLLCILHKGLYWFWPG